MNDDKKITITKPVSVPKEQDMLRWALNYRTDCQAQDDNVGKGVPMTRPDQVCIPRSLWDQMRALLEERKNTIEAFEELATEQGETIFKQRNEIAGQRRTIATLQTRLRHRTGRVPRAITERDKRWIRERFEVFTAGPYTMPTTTKAVIGEISDDELNARTKQGASEWRQILEKSTTKNLRISFETYREARLAAQKITAVRSFYGFSVRVQHRGKDIFLSPRKTTELDLVKLDGEV